ncbi:MAG: TetR/AcrR family transcriptional regulator [Mucilaginibacter sp.]
MTISKADDIVQQEILQAGLRLYRKYGPDKVTMDEVANATGRSRTSLYYYYKNRDELFQAVLDGIADSVIKEIRQAVLGAENVHDKIHAFCTAKIKTSNAWRNVFNTMQAAMDAEERIKHNRIKGILHKKLIHNEGIIIKEILSEAMNKNEIRAVSSSEQDMLAFVLSSSVRGLKSEIYDKNDPHDMGEALLLLTDIVTRWAGS